MPHRSTKVRDSARMRQTSEMNKNKIKTIAIMFRQRFLFSPSNQKQKVLFCFVLLKLFFYCHSFEPISSSKLRWYRKEQREQKNTAIIITSASVWHGFSTVNVIKIFCLTKKKNFLMRCSFFQFHFFFIANDSIAFDFCNERIPAQLFLLITTFVQ